jgi:hypothetical protein
VRHKENMSTTPVVPAPEVEVPVAPEVQVLGNSTDERQVTMSQAHLDGVIKKAMGKAGADARAEAERLRQENERLKTVVSGTGSADELERTKGLLAEERLRNQQVLDASIRQQRDLVIAEQASQHGFVDAETLQRLTRQNLRHNAETGSFEVVDDNGLPKMNGAGEPMSVTEFFRDYGDRKPYLQRGIVKPGQGSVPSQGVPLPTEDWHKYFGPRSDARAANALAMRDKRAYNRLKAAWQKETGQ